MYLYKALVGGLYTDTSLEFIILNVFLGFMRDTSAKEQKKPTQLLNDYRYILFYLFLIFYNVITKFHFFKFLLPFFNPFSHIIFLNFPCFQDGR